MLPTSPVGWQRVYGETLCMYMYSTTRFCLHVRNGPSLLPNLELRQLNNRNTNSSMTKFWLHYHVFRENKDSVCRVQVQSEVPSVWLTPIVLDNLCRKQQLHTTQCCLTLSNNIYLLVHMYVYRCRHRLPVQHTSLYVTYGRIDMFVQVSVCRNIYLGPWS